MRLADRPEELNGEARDKHVAIGLEALDLSGHQHCGGTAMQCLVGPWPQRCLRWDIEIVVGRFEDRIAHCPRQSSEPSDEESPIVSTMGLLTGRRTLMIESQS